MMRRLLILLVKGYRLFLRHWLGVHCRFEPTCSSYALDALDLHGALGGSWLTATRLMRCHPWCQGGHDPVPRQAFKPFSRLPDAARSAGTPQPKNSP
jgi:putative membrane protein insertion efficiency factor